MKLNLRSLSIIVLLSLGCKQPASLNDATKRNENWSWVVDKNTGIGEWVQLSEKSNVEEGDYVLFYSNGNRRQKGKFKKSIKYDTVYRFDIDGLPQYKYIRLPDSTVVSIWPDGPFNTHYPTGELEVKGKRKNNMLVDTCIDYFKSGQVRVLSVYREDTVWRREFHENGVLVHQGMRVDGLRDGKHNHWYSNGNLRETWFYKEGKEHGEGSLHYPSGSLRHVINYINGKREGTATSYYENGQVAIVEHYISDKAMGMYEDFYENGVLCRRVNLVEGKANGPWVSYYDNGTIAVKGDMENGQPHGTARYYSFHGKLVEVREFEYGEEVQFEKHQTMTEKEERKWDEYWHYINGTPLRNDRLNRKFDESTPLN